MTKRKLKPKTLPPEGLTAGGLTLADRALPIFDDRRRRRGAVLRKGDKYVAWAGGKKPVGEYATLGEAAAASHAEIRAEDVRRRSPEGDSQ